MAFDSQENIAIAMRNNHQIFTNGFMINIGAVSSAGRYSEWFTGSQGGNFTGSAGVATACNASTAGAIYAGQAVSPDTKYLVNWVSNATTNSNATCALFLIDILLYYPALVVTGTPTALDNTVTLPRFTTGDNVYMAAVVQSNLGAGSPVLTLTYTNSSGTGSRTASVTTVVGNMQLSGLLGNNVIIPLQTGDLGVRSIESYTIDSGDTTGTIAFILFKILETTYSPLGKYNDKTFIIPPSLAKIHDNACLSMISLNTGSQTTTTKNWMEFTFGWD